MEKYLEQILCLESENIYHVYLLPSSGNGFWDVYEQSVVNLQHLVPEVRGSVVKAVFGESGLWLRRVRLTEALVAKYSLLLYCTLLGDDYVKLTLPSDVVPSLSDTACV